MRRFSPGKMVLAATSVLFAGTVLLRAGDEPKQTPDNTISIRLTEPVKPQTFPRPIRFFIEAVIDRSGNPQPLLVYKGIFAAKPAWPGESVAAPTPLSGQGSLLLG